MTILFVPESPIKTPGQGQLERRRAAVGVAGRACWSASARARPGAGPTRASLGLFVAAAILLGAWIVNEQRAAEPLVDMDDDAHPRRLDRQRRRVPGRRRDVQLVRPASRVHRDDPSAGYGFGASVTQAGLFLLPSTMMMLLISPLAGRLSARVGSRVPLIGGSIATCLAFVLLAIAHDQKWEIYVASGILGDRHRPGLRLAGQPDRRGRAPGSDRRRHRHEHRDAHARRLGRQPDRRERHRRAPSSGAPLPTEHGFEMAFILAGSACFLGALASLAVPRPSKTLAVSSEQAVVLGGAAR